MAASGRTDAPMENAAMESRTSFRRIAALVLALALGWTAAARAQDEVSLRGSAEVEGTASEWKLGEGTARREGGKLVVTLPPTASYVGKIR